MNKIEEALWLDYNDAKKRIKSFEAGTAEYEDASKEIDNIRNELIKLKQINDDANSKALQIKAEDKREKVRNIISVITFGAQLTVIALSVRKTFKFDEVSTVTSTMGRTILNGVVPRIFNKR